MLRAVLFAGLMLLVASCAAADRSQSVCDTPPAPGETQACAFYPGYGWAHVPIYHGSAPGTTF